ncbi:MULTISPECIES: hypothetical protein [Sinorhizobium]|uniref:DUF433 domain-containing protein n=1 Tax=Sinorhizobium americanum TaxID=194963 RepID=A0A2S3YIQ5_9HYPH|nr:MULTISPECIES: hypothetical protein [Sinorhizobium]PDT41046.1 hypothetical protein CO656_13515 [Sinorhizobium sp. FG01]POH26875.1 hypothetical protein ATY31_23305 [Sinorhizobium americanum]
MSYLIGVGLYTPAEAGRLLHVPASKISRWLRGHSVKGSTYAPLWAPAINLGDDRLVLDFRDLMEIRVADAFIRAGISAIKVRAAIQIAREELGRDHPLSTDRFRTDGRKIFLHVIETDPDGQERERLLNIFRRQYEFKGIIDPILKTGDFAENGDPLLWWPGGRRLNVVVDPARSFGQPIDAASSVPTAILDAAAKQEGIVGAARAFDVPESSVRRAVEFEGSLSQRMAA